MANTQNLFFYAPTWDYPPDGPIKLGNVITSVKKPERPLHRVPPTDSDIFSTKKTNVKHAQDESQNEKFSILVKFFHLFGLDVQVSVGRQTRCVNATLVSGISPTNVPVIRENSLLKVSKQGSLFQRCHISKHVLRIAMFAAS